MMLSSIIYCFNFEITEGGLLGIYSDEKIVSWLPRYTTVKLFVEQLFGVTAMHTSIGMARFQRRARKARSTEYATRNVSPYNLRHIILSCTVDFPAASEPNLHNNNIILHTR